MKTAIEINGLTKKYGLFKAVDNLNLSIGQGEIFGLLGPNGAGKSTSILMLLGLTEPSSGNVRVCGIDPVRHPIEVKKKVGYLPEDVGFYDDLTGLENLLYTAQLNGLKPNEAKFKSIETLKRIGLSNEKDKKVGKYSRGMKQRLGLADVLIKNPEIIILDEPTLGIDPNGVKEFLELIVNLSKEKNITVLFSSHHLHQVQQVCDRVGIFVKGKLLAEGDINTLAKKLFSTNAFIIYAGVLNEFDNLSDNSGTNHEIVKLLNKIKTMEHVVSVKYYDSTFQIESTHNITPNIAKTIVDSGIPLNHLVKKEYGLDDIYYRYFEGETNYESVR